MGPFFSEGTEKHMVNGEKPSGKHTKSNGTSACFMVKSTISMVIFNSYVNLPEGRWSMEGKLLVTNMDEPRH